MSIAKSATIVLNATIKATREIIPLEIIIGKPSLVNAPVPHSNYAVLIGITGDAKGRLIIQTHEDVLKKTAEKMFGMSVEGEMLASFFGELGNMIGGSMCTNAFTEEIRLDITPPTVMLGDITMHGFKMAFRLPISINRVENTFITLALEV